MSKNRILLVEDDENLGLVVKDALELEGYDVVLAEDGKEGLQVFNQDTFDICVLDVMMPKKDGFSLAEDIRTLNTDVPILFLSAKSQTEDKIKGFKVGGDDYLTKPFNTEEFVLRIEALLRRSGKMKNEVETTFSIGKYQFDSQTYILTGPDFEKKLTKKEAQILKMLNDHKNQLLERSIILNSIWGQDDYFVGRSLDVFITKLRSYLKNDADLHIDNVHGVGFSLKVEE